MNLSTKKSGFTLIELMVVISIIGLLSSVVLASLNQAKIKARNAATIVLVSEYARAFQAYSADNYGEAPPVPKDHPRYVCLGYAQGKKCSTRTDGSTNPKGQGNDAINELIKKYIPGPPADPYGIVYYCANARTDNPVPSNPSLASCDIDNQDSRPVSLIYTLQGKISCPLDEPYPYGLNSLYNSANNTTTCVKSNFF